VVDEARSEGSRGRSAGPPSSSIPDSRFLVIGYGSALHSDDAAGQRVAQGVARWHFPHVRAIAATQLTPELAEPIARAEAVIFVDAALERREGNEPQRCFDLSRVHATDDARVAEMHDADPRALLALTRLLHGEHPPAWRITIPGTNFDLGEQLSCRTQCGIDQVLAYVQAWARQSTGTRDRGEEGAGTSLPRR
jgi:hydrogenase maturation protease